MKRILKSLQIEFDGDLAFRLNYNIKIKELRNGFLMKGVYYKDIEELSKELDKRIKEHF